MSDQLSQSTHDVFISYQHDSRAVVEALVASLESCGIRCWYAPRDVRGGYAGSIMRAIDSCRAFVVLLDRRSSESPQVLNEVEAAYGRVMSGGLPIIPVRLDDGELDAEMLYYVKRLHWVDMFGLGLDKATENLMTQLFELMPDRKAAYDAQRASDLQEAGGRREDHVYRMYGGAAKDEARRLHLQGLIMREFDKPVYDQLLAGCDDLAVLDVGCGNGEVLNDRLGSRAEVSHILGIDGDEEVLALARQRYGSDDRFTFAACDFESRELGTVLRAYLDEHSLGGFDLVTITMVMMDLNKPYVLLRTIRRYLNEGARIFIRDIDDGLNVAYPDDKGDFRKLGNLCAALPTTGFRTSGRQVFSMLQRAGYTDIVFERSGLSTVGMDHDRRYALFMTCFGWLERGLRERLAGEPNNMQYQDDLAWFEDNVDDLEESFQDPSFFYQEGFMIYTARSHQRRF